MKKKLKKGLIVTSAVSASLFNTPALITDAMAQAAEANSNDVTTHTNDNSTSNDDSENNTNNNNNIENNNQNKNNDVTNNDENTNKPVDNDEKKGDGVSQDSSIGPGYYGQPKIKTRSALSAFDTAVPASTSSFINSVANGAINGWKKYKVLPSVTIAQAILESAWGGSALTTKANNLFGIKGRYNGQYVTMPTWEVINGQNVMVNAEFRKYPSRDVSMEDHGNFLTVNSRYKNLIGVTNYKTVTKLLQQDGYATDPAYPAKLNNIIETYGLTKYDSQALNTNNKVIQIKYVQGYGINALDSNGKQIKGSNEKFKHNSRWKQSGVYYVGGKKVFKVSNTEYIPASYTDNQSPVIDKTPIQINYTKGHGVNAVDVNGNQIKGTNKKFITGTRWKQTGKYVIKDKAYYKVSNTEYIPAYYTVGGGYQAPKPIEINYVKGYGVNAVSPEGKQIKGSNKKFKTGTKWKEFGTVTIKGTKYYKVSNTENIPVFYTVGGGYK